MSHITWPWDRGRRETVSHVTRSWVWGGKEKGFSCYVWQLGFRVEARNRHVFRVIGLGVGTEYVSDPARHWPRAQRLEARARPTPPTPQRVTPSMSRRTGCHSVTFYVVLGLVWRGNPKPRMQLHVTPSKSSSTRCHMLRCPVDPGPRVPTPQPLTLPRGEHDITISLRPEARARPPPDPLPGDVTISRYN